MSTSDIVNDNVDRELSNNDCETEEISPHKRPKLTLHEEGNQQDEPKPSFLSPPKSVSIAASSHIEVEVNNPSTLFEKCHSHDCSDEVQHPFRDLLMKEANYDPNSSTNTTKRSSYLSWEDYFMAIASLSAQRSKDPHTQMGACIVDNENRTIGIGYNGFPSGCSDDILPWASNHSDVKNVLHTKDPFVVHAEVNAILNKCSSDVKGARMYVLQYPNNECAKIIIQSGIREIIYLHDPHPNAETYRASRIMFEMSGVQTRAYKPSQQQITLDFGPDPKIGEVPKNMDDKSSPSATVINPDMITCEKMKTLLQTEANYNIDNPRVNNTPKRSDYLCWDDYFMAISFLSANRSKDPNTQVGACIVNKDKRIIGIGYNGFPRNCSDEHLPWARKGPTLHTKYPFVVHAEVNAILNKCSADVVGATLYVALFPCNDCAKVIIQAGIREIVYLNDFYHDTESCRASRIMFEMAGIKLRYHRPLNRLIDVNFA